MKTIIQVAIWEPWSLWMVVVMVALIAIYNGAMYNRQTSEGNFRIALICVYGGLSIGHAWRWWCVILRILEAVAKQACWAIISNIFRIIPTSEYLDPKSDLKDMAIISALASRDGSLVFLRPPTLASRAQASAPTNQDYGVHVLSAPFIFGRVSIHTSRFYQSSPKISKSKA